MAGLGCKELEALQYLLGIGFIVDNNATWQDDIAG